MEEEYKTIIDELSPVENINDTDLLYVKGETDGKATAQQVADYILEKTEPTYETKSHAAQTFETKSNVDEIRSLIPTQATTGNQLADKDFVNSTVGTNTANYIYKTVDEENVPFDSIEELESYPGSVTPNDYAFVSGIDEDGNIYYDRYKAKEVDGSIVWGKEYRLNNSSFTAKQWEAINSGITRKLVEKIGQGGGGGMIIENVTATVSNTTGTPSCVVTGDGSEENPLNFAFSGIKGSNGTNGTSISVSYNSSTHTITIS